MRGWRGPPRPRPVRGAPRAGLRRPPDPFARPRRFLLPRAIGPIASRSGRPATPMHRGIHPGDFSAVRWVRRYIREHGPFDVIHGHSAKGALARLASWRPGTPVFYTPHGFIAMDPGLAWRQRLSLPRARMGPQQAVRPDHRRLARGAAVLRPERPGPLPGGPDPQRDRLHRLPVPDRGRARGSTSRRIVSLPVSSAASWIRRHPTS